MCLVPEIKYYLLTYLLTVTFLSIKYSDTNNLLLTGFTVDANGFNLPEYTTYLFRLVAYTTDKLCLECRGGWSQSPSITPGEISPNGHKMLQSLLLHPT